MKRHVVLIEALLIVLSTITCGYSYYAPGQGRWLSRDPLADIGSVVNIVPSPESDLIAEDKTSISLRLTEIMKKLKAFAASAGITLDQQTLINFQQKIGLELQKERGTRSASAGYNPNPPMNHLFRFVENNPISHIDPYGLICFPISPGCEFCTWPNCTPPRRPPMRCDTRPPPDDPTGIVCIHCTF